MTTAEIIDRLQQATTDLLWVSESDYPFEVMTWQRGVEMTPTALFTELTAPDTAIETSSLQDFFAPALKQEDWYDAAELDRANRYTELVRTIESSLAEVRVFRVGSVEISIYIVGKTPAGDVVGLKTQAVET